jgi:hypothetical protein
MKNCEDCYSTSLNYDDDRAEYWCDDCGAVFEDHVQTEMRHPVAPEANGSVSTKNPYHRDVTGTRMTTWTAEDRAMMGRLSAESRARMKRLEKMQKWSAPSQVSHYASRIWDLIAEVYGEELANTLYRESFLDDMLRPIEARISDRMVYFMKRAKASGICLKQPLGAVSRSLLEGATQEERDASKVSVRSKDAVFAAALLNVYGEHHPSAPRDMLKAQRTLLARSGLDGRRAKTILMAAVREFKRHLRDLNSIGAFTPRDDSSRDAQQERHLADESPWLDVLADFFAAQPTLDRYAQELLHDAALRLDAMRADLLEGDNHHPSPFGSMCAEKRVGLAALAAMRARGVERGMATRLGVALDLAPSTLGTLHKRLEKSSDPRLGILDIGFALTRNTPSSIGTRSTAEDTDAALGDHDEADGQDADA